MNKARYKCQLQGALDDVEGRAVEKLLAEEEARLKALERARSEPTKP